MEIRMEASKAVRMLQIMSARLREGKALFDPIKIDIIQHKDGYRASSMMMNRGQTAYMVSRFVGLDVSGLEDNMPLCVSADTLIAYFEECYGSDEMIKMWNDDVFLKTVNENSDYPTEVKHPMTAEDNSNLFAVDEFPFKMKDGDGIPYYRQGTVKPDTEVIIDVAEIQKAIKHKSKVAKHATGGRSPKYYDFNFTEEGSTVIMGDDRDLSMTPITKTLNCTVEGPGATFKIGDEDLEHIMGVLTGVIMIYCKTDYPIWVTQKGDDFLVGYLIAPKAEDEEVEVEVTDDGDVEVLEIDEEDDEIDEGDEDEEEPEEIPAEADEPEEEPVEVDEPEEEPEDSTEETEDEGDNIPEEPEEEVQEEADEDGEDLEGLDLDIS